MGCPVHIWLPAMAGLAPIGRIARDRLRAMRVGRTANAQATPAREVRRWAPIDPNRPPDVPDHSSD